MGPGMFDGLVTGILVCIAAAFVLGGALVGGLVWLWPYLPSIRVVWP